jgi:phage tail sheath protein FI
VTRFIPPVGYVAGKRALAHNQTGPHLPAAGLLSVARFVVGLKSAINKTVGDDLDENFVNAIRVIQNTIRIYGARSCSSDTDNFRYITQQDVVNSIVTECYRSIEDVVFSAIDGRNTIFANVESRLLSILSVMRNIGALYPAFDANGRQLDQGYTVRCDASLNPASQLATGLVKATVGVRVSSVGDKIEIEIVKSNLTSSVV